MFRSFHLLPNVMHTHETLVLHRSISITPAIKKEKKKPSYNSSINKPKRRTRFRFETKVPIVSTLRAETWRSLSLLPLPRNHETVHDPMTPPRATILRFLDFHFALLYLRSQTVTRLFENSARSKRFFFFYSSLVSSTRIRRSRNKSGVVILFFCKRRRKTEGKRAITSTRRSIIDRTFERSPVESSIIERSSRMQKGLQAGWGWGEAGTIMPRLKDRFERWRVSWLIMNIDGCGGWERSRNCFRRFLFFQICLCHGPDFVFWK